MVKKRKKNGKLAADDEQAKAREALLVDGGGYDWGLEEFHLAAANDQLARRLYAGGFSGCAYGLVSKDGPPFICLVGTQLAGMRTVLALIQEWVDAAGPNALTVEILFDGQGYVISLSQQRDLLRWRLLGLDTANKPLVITMSISKRLDSRQPFLADLAEYSREPVAPVYLTVGALPQGGTQHAFAASSGELDMSLEGAILIPGIEVYLSPGERPRDSMVRLQTEIPEGPDPDWPPAPRTAPQPVADVRQRRLLATMPRTMHALRNWSSAGDLFAASQLQGCPRWQVEQAICNLRLAGLIGYQPSSEGKRLAMIEMLRADFLEPASAALNLGNFSPADVAAQVALDAAYLLRRVDKDHLLADTLSGRTTRLAELGYG